MLSENIYQNVYWESDDGLKLHCRDYAAAVGKTPIICIPGLTRNVRDFEHLGPLMDGDRRIIMVNLRGRGESEYAKDSSSYHPKVYVADVIKLMDQMEISKAVFLGTSLGGIVTMVLAASHPERLAGAMLNDIGPEVDPKGLERIGNYVGQGRSFETWAHAARDNASSSGDIFPDYDLNDWIAFSKKLYRMNSSGRIKLDYDLKISEPFDSKGGGSAALWKALESLKNTPTLLLRGELSDLFSAETAARMLEVLEQGELAVIPRVGHAPSLEEPAAINAITNFLNGVD